MKTKNILIIISIFIFFSCNKDLPNNGRNLPTLIELTKVVSKKQSKVALMLEKTGTLNDNKKVYPRIEATFLNEKNPSGPLKRMTEVNFGGMRLFPNSENVFDNLPSLMRSMDTVLILRAMFGKTIDINVISEQDKNLTVRNENEMSGQLYIPKEIDGDLNLTKENKLLRNSLLAWTSDNKNVKGVYISIFFDSYAFGNESFKATPIVKKAIQTDDTGNYTFTNSDFKGIPQGAKVQIEWGRGNYNEIDGKQVNADALFLAYSSIKKTVILE